MGRNDPCHCGSGRKYKQCCLLKDEAFERAAIQRADRRAKNVIGSVVTVFQHAIDRVRSYNPRKIH